MRRFSIPLVIASILLLVTATSASGWWGDRAYGQGVRIPSCLDGCPAGTFSFDARSRPNGGNSRGWLVVDFGYASFTGKVTCLDVSGRWATMFGQISAGTGEADPSTFDPEQDPVYFVAVVRDRGAALNGRPAPDRMSFIAWDTEEGWGIDPGIPVGEICGDPFTAIGDASMFGLIAGNLKVIDR